MSDRKFLETPYHPAGYELPQERVKDYRQALRVLGPDAAESQGGRCISCATPFCNGGCPVGQKVPLFLQAVERGQWQEAHEVAIQSPLYGLFGLICPQQEGLCESSCTVAKVKQFGTEVPEVKTHALTDTIVIGGVEAAIWRTALDKGWYKLPTPKVETDKSVAIIGAGPAGIYAAIDMRKYGHQVTVYDAWSEVGGLLLNGIPNFKLDKKDLATVREAMADTGIKFELDTRIGQSGKPALQDLLHNNDAVLIATGTYAARTITSPDSREPIKGHELAIRAMDFLIAHNDLVRLGTPVPEELKADGKRVTIIGVADTSMDCFGTSLRGSLQSAAREITILQRSAVAAGALKEKLARKAEATVVLGASDELFIHASPLQITQKGDHLALEVRNGHGRRQTIETDMVINATGFEKEDLAKKFDMDIVTAHRGATNVKGLFVTGDALTGASLAVKAAQDGRMAAEHARSYLRHLKS